MGNGSSVLSGLGNFWTMNQPLRSWLISEVAPRPKPALVAQVLQKIFDGRLHDETTLFARLAFYFISLCY
jgi:hypothetical protein